MEHKTKNYLATLLSSLITVIIIFFIQINAAPNNCSYLDPLLIDVLALLAATFLIIEGLINIHKNQDTSLKYNMTRIIRVVFGFCIITIHLIQLIHK